MKKAYKDDENGLWAILGEDQNCDYNGPRLVPNLGYARGNYADVLRYAKTLKGFFSYGSGGEVIKIENVVDVPVGGFMFKDLKVGDTFQLAGAGDSKNKTLFIKVKKDYDQNAVALNGNNIGWGYTMGDYQEIVKVN
jgi:hypothetical protein